MDWLILIAKVVNPAYSHGHIPYNSESQIIKTTPCRCHTLYGRESHSEIYTLTINYLYPASFAEQSKSGDTAAGMPDCVMSGDAV